MLRPAQQSGIYENIYFIAPAEKISSLKAEVVEIMLYDCVTWTLAPDDVAPLRKAWRGFVLRNLN